MNMTTNNRDNLFVHYGATRTIFLDSSHEEKIKRFRLYYQEIYKHLLGGVSVDAKVVDLGCNRGYLLRVLEEQGFTNLTGVDLSEDDIAIAEKLSSADFVKEDIFQFLKNNKKKIDVIVMRAVIEHIQKDKIILLLSLINEALTPNGFALIDTDNADWYFSHHDRYMDFTHEVGFTIESMRQINLMVFKNVFVKTYKSPIVFYGRFKKLHSLRYELFRFLFKKILTIVEPEMATTPLLDRYLIAKVSNT